MPTSRFAPGVLVHHRRLPWTLLVLAVALGLVRLGFWQLQRHAARLQRNAPILARMVQPPVQLTGPVADPTGLDYRQAIVAGTFDYGHEILLRTRSYRGRPGFNVLTPLRIAGSQVAVLVDRGWIPADQSAPTARAVFQGPATADVRGLVRPSQRGPTGQPLADVPSGADQTEADAWSSVDIPRIQQQLPYKLLPFYIEQAPEPGAPALPAPVTDLVLDEGRHLGYAVQWFTGAVMLLAGYVVVLGRRTLPAPGETQATQA